jgi:uncharacterized protein YoxC
MIIIFKKVVLMALSVALVFAAFPVTSAFAESTSTLTPTRGLTIAKLEKVWARQLKIYHRVGKIFTDTDAKIAKAQALIDKAAANGKDVSAVQSALDAFESALKSTRPIYEGIQIVVTSHQGFDVNGKVIDFAQAKSTVKEMGTKLKEVKSSMNGTGKTLIDALKAFRKTNK